MELEIKKYLAFITILMTSFLLVHYYFITNIIQDKQEAYYWPQTEAQGIDTSRLQPKVVISHKNGQSTITWVGYSQPVDIQKCLSLEEGVWTTISKNNSSGKFVDTDAKEPMAFYRLNYVTQL